MVTGFGAEDVGKTVCTADGVEIGRVARVEGGEAYVTAREGLVDHYGSLLAPCHRSSRHYCLNGERVGEVTEEEIRLSVTVEELSFE